MQGIGGFADGFSGGLNQGMGIIRQARQDVAAQQQAQFQRQMALRQDARAEKQLGFQEAQEGRSAELHPIELATKKTAAERAIVDLSTAQTEEGMKKIEAKYLEPKLVGELHQTEAQTANTVAQTARTRQGTVLDARQDARAGQKHAMDMRTSMASEGRAAEEHDLKMGSQLMPFYLARVQSGLPIPPKMAEIMRKSPISLGNMMDMAQGSSRFAPVLQKVAAGDSSWMKNANDRSAVAGLARSRGMAIAQANGLAANSARITNWQAGKGGTVMLTVAGFDPKTRQYRYVQQPVNSERLVGEMSNNAKAGSLMLNHPQFQDLAAKYAKMGKAAGGDFTKAAEDDYQQLMTANRQLLTAATDENNTNNIPKGAVERAKQWMEKYGANRDQYVQDYSGFGQAAVRARQPDTNPWDFDRLAVAAHRYTRSFDPNVNMARVNSSMRYMDAMSDKWDADPELRKFAQSHGGKEMRDDPAKRVVVANEIYANPQMRQRMLALVGRK